MGYVKHHSIAVTGFLEDQVKRAHQKAKEKFGELTTEIISSKVNGIKSFFIAPDGSKEGWETSDEFERLRDSFVEYLDSQKEQDGSNCLSYAMFFYGDEMGDSGIIKHN